MYLNIETGFLIARSIILTMNALGSGYALSVCSDGKPCNAEFPCHSSVATTERDGREISQYGYATYVALKLI
ncbi:hypothetical protein J6590_046200 [Homalodisca vitripennis]|nr:hypothetical protein J6590_046200 [Homalodisca vitripennis]